MSTGGENYEYSINKFNGLATGRVLLLGNLEEDIDQIFDIVVLYMYISIDIICVSKHRL